MLLPLFPLNLVLFPGMPVQLHIFEERYKEMISECIESRSPFGIILIEQGAEAFGPVAAPHLIGTTAHITEIQRLSQGRMNIVAMGQDRFRIRSLDNKTHPYLVGDVEYLTMASSLLTVQPDGADKLKVLIQRYVKALGADQQIDLDFDQISLDPISLAYLGAGIIQTDNKNKQLLLENNNLNALMRELIQLYRSEITLMEILMSPPRINDADELPFSVN
jgi:Lon protease-like protein